MDIVVTGRHLTVSDQLREHIEDKLSKVSQLAPQTRRIEVKMTHEPNRRQAKSSERVEITCIGRGPVVRAEATSEDRAACIDMAMDKLMERLRRAHDKRQVHRGRRTPESVAAATARAQNSSLAETPVEAEDANQDDDPFGDSPIEVREKVHASVPMSLSDALNEMELVGHDFYLYQDADTGAPSVLYRRRGWSYGVLHLDMDASKDSQAV